MWTRSFIISTASDLGDLQMVTKRLLRNPADFANVLRLFYGKEKTAKFEALLKEHLLIAAKLVNDAKAGDVNSVAKDNEKWHENADDIAAFLSDINPYWNKLEWQNMLYDHLKMTANMAIERLGKQYDADIRQYENIENQAFKMADVMSNGVIRQFKYR